MSALQYWYDDAVIYGVDVGTYMDGNGDGIGDFPGLTSRLDHIQRLGASCLWLLPFFPSPNRDNGYDVEDYFAVAPEHGTLGDFVTFLRAAEERGIRVLLDLVVNHTSDRHPWFRAARRDRDSPYRDYYIWADEPPPVPPGKGNIFPGVERKVWTRDEEAGQYYYHRFYHFEPGLRIANPRVREEIRSIMGFWLQLGIAGFRLDAASHMIDRKGLPGTKPDDPHGVLREFSAFARQRRGDAVLLAEADVEPQEIRPYFGHGGDEMQLLFNFVLDNYLMLALARGEAEPIVEALKLLPEPPRGAQYANFLRNLDELDLERLTEAQREEVYAAFAPKPEMRIYGRGIRRRLAPMLGGDGPRLRMAWSLLFSLPGVPMLVYGDEIGMGEDLALPERNAVRTPMQWDAGPNAGFSTAPADRLPWPVITKGTFACRKVNVADQRRDGSLLHFMEGLVRTRRENPEIGAGRWAVLDTGDRAVFAHRCWRGDSAIVAVHNLSDEPREVDLGLSKAELRRLRVVFGDANASPVEGLRGPIALEGYGFRWLRLSGGG